MEKHLQKSRKTYDRALVLIDLVALDHTYFPLNE